MMIHLRKMLFGFILIFGCVTVGGIRTEAETGIETKTEGDYTYYDLQDHAIIAKYIGSADEVEIPAELGGKKVTSIASSAFEGCSSLTSITVPDAVTQISIYAFKDCSSLESINIPSGVTSIEDGAFQNCSNLKEINIPDGVTEIQALTFKECSSLTSIHIPDGVTAIGISAFSGCSSLTSIDIPNGVTSIGVQVFLNCSSLTSIDIPDGVISIGASAFSGCSSLTSIDIPNGVTSIEMGAFSECSSLTSIDIPDGVISIGASAFQGCSSLTSIDIPNGVTSIEMGAFSGCSSLTSIDIPNGVTSIDIFTFQNCSKLTSISLPDGLTNIGENAFFKCKSLASINIPDSVQSIGDRAFKFCTILPGLTLLGSIKEIGEDVFAECREDMIVYSEPGTVAAQWSQSNLPVNNRGFILSEEKCKVKLLSDDVANPTVAYMESTDIDAKVIQIPDTVTIGDVEYKVTDIGKDAFSSCTSLEEVVLPASLEHIDSEAFAGVTDMDGDQSFKITVPEDLEDISNVGIENITNIQYITIYVAEGSQAAIYLQQTGNTNIVTYMGQYSGTGDKKEENVPEQSQQTVTPETKPQVGEIYAVNSLNYKVTSSKYVTFTGASKKTIRTITIPAKVTILGQSFQVTAIEKKALKKYTRLTTVVIGSNVKTIGNEAFMNCRNLNKITIGKNVKTIGKKTFYGDKNLTRIIFKGSKVTKVGKKTLHNVPKKVKITAPKKAMNKYKKLLNAAK